MRGARNLKPMIVMAMLMVVLGLDPAQAHLPDGQEGMNLYDATQGSLLIRTDRPNRFIAAPILKTDVRMTVTGMIARTTVRQRFTNASGEWVEGVYVFPMPDMAAVDHLRMRIGDRIVEGQIQERAEARRTYQQARDSGRRASLVEQERPNIFTATVANIGPGEEVVVEIEYQEMVRYDQGQFRIRFPMVVGPRYIPGVPKLVGEEMGIQRGDGWAQDTDRSPDASRITPPVQEPSRGFINPVSLSIDLLAGVPLASLQSAYHSIQITPGPEGHQHITLLDETVPSNHDFELSWQPAIGHAPTAALFTQTKDGESYALLMVVPPDPSTAEASPPVVSREVIFVIDTSGSMHGESLAQAKDALGLALARLKPSDTFNVIQFNSVTDSLFVVPQPATRTHLEKAARYVANLRANGGTEMLPALLRALDGNEESSRFRQVMFLTDGQIGNEAELFDTIRRRLGDSRLFTIGIGSSPNSHFMRKAAVFGRGSFTYIGNTVEVKDRMDALFRKAELPALTDLRMDFAGWEEAEILPARIPDLYVGEPVVVAIRTAHLPDRAVFRGRVGNVPWEAQLLVDHANDRDSLSVHWGREKISSLMDQPQTNGSQEERRQAVVQVALRHHLVSQYTSLVAVDVTPARPMEQTLSHAAIKTNLPQGQDYTAIFGLPRTGTTGGLQMICGMLSLMLAMALWQRCRRPT